MTDNIPESLLVAYKQNKLLPLIGAGVSMSLRNLSKEPLFPSWKELLLTAAKKIEAEGETSKSKLIIELINQDEYKLAANFAKKGLVGSLWNNFLKDVFSIKRENIEEKSLALPRAIWGLSERLITINYDKVLRFACPSQDVLELDNTSKSELTDFVNAKNNSYAIWHLHGRIDNQAHLIFNSDSYDKLYIESNTDYKAAIDIFRSICRDSKLLFVGCSLEDAELLLQLAEQYALFDGNTGPHYVLVHAKDEERIREKIKTLPIVLVIFEDYGTPLINKIEQISSQSSAAQIIVKKNLFETANVQKRVAVLSANPIDKNYQYDELRKELKKLKCEVNFFPLNTRVLNELEKFDHIFILSKLIKAKIIIEDEALCSRRISFKELEDSFGDSNTKGIFIFLDHHNKSDLDSDDVSSLTNPTLIFPQLNKVELNSFEFKIFKRKDFLFFENSTIVNKSQFNTCEFKGIHKTVSIKTKLPENIDPKIVKNYVGRITDLENICRKIIDLRENNEILTIKGSGGLGKTHTVKKVVVELAARGFFGTGIDFIDCEFINDYKLFEYNIARCFDLEHALDIKEQISETTSKADRLIILDNVETLLHLEDSLVTDVTQPP